jgi:trans-aconitate methyltransferase
MTDLGQLFDDCASEYNATIQRAIGASGESVEFFAELRARLIVGVMDSTNDDLSMLDFGCGIGNMTRAVAKRFPRADLVGADLSDQKLGQGAPTDE